MKRQKVSDISKEVYFITFELSSDFDKFSVFLKSFAFKRFSTFIINFRAVNLMNVKYVICEKVNFLHQITIYLCLQKVRLSNKIVKSLK